MSAVFLSLDAAVIKFRQSCIVVDCFTKDQGRPQPDEGKLKMIEGWLDQHYPNIQHERVFPSSENGFMSGSIFLGYLLIKIDLTTPEYQPFFDKTNEFKELDDVGFFEANLDWALKVCRHEVVRSKDGWWVAGEVSTSKRESLKKWCDLFGRRWRTVVDSANKKMDKYHFEDELDAISFWISKSEREFID
jgi:hypothetical protein